MLPSGEAITEILAKRLWESCVLMVGALDAELTKSRSSPVEDVVL